MNAIQYSLNYVKTYIPRQILELGFLRNDLTSDLYTTIDDKIIHNVINFRVKPDLDLNGGTEVMIPVKSCEIKQVPGLPEFIISVPKHLTNNCSIIRPMNLVSRNYTLDPQNYYTNYKSSSLITLGSKMIQNVDFATVVSTSRLELIGDNKIAVREPRNYLEYTLLQALIENNAHLENITRPFFKDIAELILLATKNYIYVNKAIELDMGYSYGGYEISIIKDTIDEYKDSKEQYDEQLKRWKKLAVMNDNARFQKYIAYAVGNNM